MTEKVKIPQNVADAIETLRNAEYSDYGVVIYAENGGAIHLKEGAEIQKVIRNWTFGNNGANADKLLDALRIGYEIEPEPLKVGDLVISEKDGRTNPSEIYEIIDCDKTHANLKGIIGIFSLSQLRHATPEEIEEEEERQKWAEIGREVGEIRDGDIAIARNGAVLTDVWDIRSFQKHGDLVGLYPAEAAITFGGGEANA